MLLGAGTRDVHCGHHVIARLATHQTRGLDVDEKQAVGLYKSQDTPLMRYLVPRSLL